MFILQVICLGFFKSDKATTTMEEIQNTKATMEDNQNGDVDLLKMEDPKADNMEETDHFGPDSLDEEDETDLEVITFSRRFPKHIKTSLQKVWPIVKSALQDYHISCSLNLVKCSMTFSTTRPTDQDIIDKARDLLHLLSVNVPASQDDPLYPPKPDMTFSTSKTNSEDNVDRARTALQYLQLRVPIPVVIEVINGTFTESIMIGYQKGGLCSEFNIHSTQFAVQTRLLSGCLQELEQLTGCHIYNVAKRVIIVGTLQGAKVARKIVEDCIVHNVPPTPRIRDIMRINVATQKLETLRL